MAKTVLVVDDDPSIVSFVSDVVKEMGHAAVGATDGYSVMEMVRKHQPAVVVLDYNMPAASGHEVYKRLRALTHSASTPIVFLSGTSPFEIQMMVPEGPLVRFLSKPVDVAALRSCLESLLGPSAGPGVLDLDAA